MPVWPGVANDDRPSFDPPSPPSPPKELLPRAPPKTDLPPSEAAEEDPPKAGWFKPAPNVPIVELDVLKFDAKLVSLVPLAADAKGDLEDAFPRLPNGDEVELEKLLKPEALNFSSEV